MTYHGEEQHYYNLAWSKSAEKSLEKLGKKASDVRHKIKSNLTKNQKDPYPSPTNKNVKALQGKSFKGMYRYRFGKYRAMYTIRQQELLITVLEVGPRGEFYNMLERKCGK
jgi:mRNA interferase RelE/StbE